MRRVSVCVTVFNEEGSVEVLLKSLVIQSHLSEIIICDGGSTDKTVSTIQRFQKKYPYIKLLISQGNVAHGRNVAIRNATFPIIATIDCGCVAKRNWLAHLCQGYRRHEEVDIVAGFYQMKWKTPFQKIMALYRGTHPKRYDKKTFIPSCRSVAFKKSVWEELGGFNEKLSLSGEDTLFFNQAVKRGYRIYREKDALVEWREPEQFGIPDFLKFYHYAKGDAQTGIWWDPVKKWRTHNIKILSIFIRYLLLLSLVLVALPLFLLCILLYSLWSIYKWRDVVTKWSERIWIPVVQMSTDIMVMSGFLWGFWGR